MATWVCKELLHAAQWFCSQTECPATELLSETSCCQLSLPAYIDICPAKGWPNLVAIFFPQKLLSNGKTRQQRDDGIGHLSRLSWVWTKRVQLLSPSPEKHVGCKAYTAVQEGSKIWNSKELIKKSKARACTPINHNISTAASFHSQFPPTSTPSSASGFWTPIFFKLGKVPCTRRGQCHWWKSV